MKSTVESKLRKIIREELDYYFDKLQQTLLESNSITSRANKSNISENKSSDVSEERARFRKKYSGLLGAISENIDESDLQETSNSILENKYLNALGKSDKTKSVYDALTKDYSALIKKMETK